MSVTAYDSSFSFRQGQVARLGDKAASRGPMSEEERRRFEASPFMQRMKELDERSWQKFSERDKKRKERDPNFKPQDADFQAPKAHKYDKTINYYTVLGLDEYASNDEVKKAYRKLSLSYHPDKTTGKSQEERDEAAAIFMEIKNAYKTLSDEPTRRQYDFERERDVVSAESNGKKKQDRASFNAQEAMKKLLEKAKENQKLPAQVVPVRVPVRLEKFVFGGHKKILRERRVKDRMYGGFVEDTRTFRIDVPAGAEDMWSAEFRRQGDQHEHRDTDTVKFVFEAKSHAAVERSGSDLRSRFSVSLGEGFRRRPFLSTEASSVSGRHVLVWGRNPFCQAVGGASAELRLRLHGEGVDRKGALCLRFRMGLRGEGEAEQDRAAASAGGSSSSASVGGTRDAAARAFLTRFGLGPPHGFVAAGASEASPRAASEAPPMLRRRERRRAQEHICELDLFPASEALGLATKPHCSLQLYSTKVPGPVPMFALCLTSPPCARKSGAGDWDRLKARLVPALQASAFRLFRLARDALPRSLARTPTFPERAFLQAKAPPPMPWKRLGDEAFARGDFWQAASFYTHRVQELGLDHEEGEAPPPQEAPRGPDQVPEGAKVLSNRSACLAKLGDFSASAADARRAIALAPRWARPWGRVGDAARRLGQDAKEEGAAAYRKAVELEPSRANVAKLQELIATQDGASADAAHATKEEGNEAMRSGQLGLAVAAYTEAIARLPLKADAVAERPDPHALLRAVLHSNRSGAFLRLRNFEMAVADGQDAVAAQPGFVSARCQLGVALLANNMHQEAYAEFAKALQLSQEEHNKARKGCNVCLQEMVRWRSASATLRFQSRFFLDIHRPRGTTRVFALSDIHFDHRENEDWVHGIDDNAFQDDVLIVAGNLADSKVAVGRGLTTLRQKFRRVFYTVGNHEMSITHAEHARYPDSIAKLHAIIAECDELGVDIFPAPVCEGVTILPLFSWYSAEFDEKDPFPDPNAHYDKHCKWPMDPDLQVWKYMAKLNESFLAKPYFGTVISFSHFLPRKGLPFDASRKNSAKAVGCEMLEEQLRAAGSKLHVYGHSRSRFGGMLQGVRYANMPLGFETDWPRDTERRLMMIYDGKNLCTQDWGADGEPPLGFVKRVLHAEFFDMTGLTETNLRRLRAALQRLTSTCKGVQLTFDTLRTQREGFRDIWADIEKVEGGWSQNKQALSTGATHGLLLIADDIVALRTALNCDAFKQDFAKLAETVSRSRFVANMPLGVDLKHERKKDPSLILFFMRTKVDVTGDSKEYNQLQKMTDAINSNDSLQGMVSVGLQPTGFGKFSHKELLKEVQVAEDFSSGCTHCFAVAADNPHVFKALVQSKTWKRWRDACDQAIRKDMGLMAFAVPLEMSTTASAPKPERKSGSTPGPQKR